LGNEREVLQMNSLKANKAPNEKQARKSVDIFSEGVK
jgi:hypothetical protein